MNALHFVFEENIYIVSKILYYTSNKLWHRMHVAIHLPNTNALALAFTHFENNNNEIKWIYQINALVAEYVVIWIASKACLWLGQNSIYHKSDF